MIKRNGFTIIELIVVIAVIIILAVFLFPNLGVFLAESRNAKRLSDVQSYITALNSYYADNNGRYPSGDPAGCCLGTDNGSNPVCIGNCTNVNAAISKYIVGLPSDTQFKGSNGATYGGYRYFASTNTHGIACTLSTGCNRFEIDYALEGNGTCGANAYSGGWHQGKTTCFFPQQYVW